MNNHETNEAKTGSIDRMIDEIDQGIIQIPEFQRDFVWEVDKTYDLFDSLISDIFIGAIIFGVPSFEITARQIDASPRKRKKGGKKKTPSQVASEEATTYSKNDIDRKKQTGGFRLILDGQQRLTSLYRALKKRPDNTEIDTVWMWLKTSQELAEQYPDVSINSLTLEQLVERFNGASLTIV